MNNDTIKNWLKSIHKNSPKTFKSLINTDFEKIKNANNAIQKKKSVELSKPQSQRYNGMTKTQFDKSGVGYEDKPIEHTTADSSAVENVRYDPKNENLDIMFVGGEKEYRYPNVDKKTFEAFMRTPSKGSFVNDVLKPYFSDYSNPSVQQKISEE